MEQMTDRELFTAIYGDVEQINTDVEEIKQKITQMQECILTLKQSTDDKKLSSIEMTLENEIRNNINIIVKRQSDIMKLLRDNMVVENNNKMFSVRMNILETDVRNIKEKIGIA